MEFPDTRYIRTPDDVYLACQTLGEGPIDLVLQIDWPGNIDMQWEFPVMRALINHLAEFARVILHDHRGIGLSSRNVPIPTLETRVSDLGRVLEALDSQHPTLVGFAASGAVNALFAASRPERTASLAWLDPVSRYRWAPDNPWGRPEGDLEAELRDLELWGTSAYGLAFAEYEAAIGNPIPVEDTAAFARASRNACTPDVARELSVMWAETDVRDILAAIKVPTLILSHVDLGERDRAADVASRIHGAELVEIRGLRYSPETMEKAAEHIARFIGMRRRPPTDLDTILATVLFTDIVGSTERAAALGDRRWAELVERHHERVRAAIERWHGTERDTAGDGFYTTFEGPARAIRCAHEIVEGVRELGIEVRAGIHTGECRVIDRKVGGIAVAIGARIAATAGPSEVRTSRTVKDLVAGSGLAFEDAGEHDLKGVPGRWQLYVVPAV